MRRERLTALSSGFTLIEMLITVLVMAVVLTMGISSMKSVINTNRAATHANDFLAALALARSEAVKRGQRVVVCRSDVATSSNCQTSSTYGWEKGWSIFLDSNNNGTNDTGETIIRVGGPLDGGDTLTGTSSASNNVQNYISYAPDGVARLTSGVPLSGTPTFTFGLCNSHYKNTITISGAGMAMVQKIGC